MMIFVYFNVIPLWFPIIMLIKLCEFVITSTIVIHKKNMTVSILFDSMGKWAARITMVLPGIFVLRCIVINYILIMQIGMYIVTVLFAFSLIKRSIVLHKILYHT
jgi:hypothetical protein